VLGSFHVLSPLVLIKATYEESFSPFHTKKAKVKEVTKRAQVTWPNVTEIKCEPRSAWLHTQGRLHGVTCQPSAKPELPPLPLPMMMADAMYRAFSQLACPCSGSFPLLFPWSLSGEDGGLSEMRSTSKCFPGTTVMYRPRVQVTEHLLSRNFRVSQHWPYWHFGLDHSFWEDGRSCLGTMGCLATSLSSTH
jgi:hypothetical protein